MINVAVDYRFERTNMVLFRALIRGFLHYIACNIGRDRVNFALDLVVLHPKCAKKSIKICVFGHREK